MALDLGAALKQKYAGVPGYVWAGAIAVGTVIVGPKLLGGITGTSAGSSGAQPPSTSYQPPPPGPGPGSQPPSPSGSNIGKMIADSSANPNSQYKTGIPSYNVTSADTQPGFLGLIPNGTVLTPTGQTINAKWGSGLNTFVQGTTPTGQKVWVSISDVTQQAGGVGGPKPGNRSANLWSYGHPAIKRRVAVPHTVTGIGGPGHVPHVMALANRTGIHPARLLAANSYPGPYTHIA